MAKKIKKYFLLKYVLERVLSYFYFCKGVELLLLPFFCGIHPFGLSTECKYFCHPWPAGIWSELTLSQQERCCRARITTPRAAEKMSHLSQSGLEVNQNVTLVARTLICKGDRRRMGANEIRSRAGTERPLRSFCVKGEKNDSDAFGIFCFPSAARAASRGGELWLGLETGCGQRRWVWATCHEASVELICISSVCVCVSVRGLYKRMVYCCASNEIMVGFFVPEVLFTWRL